MCGIAGLFNISHLLQSSEDMGKIIGSMNDSMAHRGPDDAGIWVDANGRCVLGQRRLSIIDVSAAGHQPMPSGCGRWMITFNGEIYNFQEIRPQIEAAGVTLRGRTDTEVLLESVVLWGKDALPKLDGMFAFAAFNQNSGELLLARDPFGEKPLYYMELPGGGLAFSSELQALECLPWFDGEVSADAIGELLMFQYIGAPRTIYRAVKKLEPGCWLQANPDGRLETGRYYEFKPGREGFVQKPLGELVDELEDILTRSVNRRLIADVPLGAFLSGGVDSSTVCALVHNKLGRPLKTFSIGFENTPESEHEAARMFARHIGTEHHDQILAPHASDFLLESGRLLDEPNADSSCMPTYLLARYARQFVTVAVSGDGGDELFGGYGRYFTTLDENERWARGKLPTWRPGQAYYADRILVSVERHIDELFGFVPEGLESHISRLREEINRDSVPLLCRLRKTDVDNYMPGAVLPKVDRMSMQHSLEVRTPFLNVELARFAEKIPPHLLYDRGRGKILLRELACRYLPRNWIDAPKKGFGIPMTQWGRDELLGVAGKLLESEDSRLRSALGSEGIDRFLARQRSPHGFSTYQVWALAMLESWCRHHPAKLPDLSSQRQRGKVLDESAPDQPIAETAQPGRLRRIVDWLTSHSSTAARLRHSRLVRGSYTRLRNLRIELANSVWVRYFQSMPTQQKPLPKEQQPVLHSWRFNQGSQVVFERGEIEHQNGSDSPKSPPLNVQALKLLFRYRFSGSFSAQDLVPHDRDAGVFAKGDFSPLTGWLDKVNPLLFPGLARLPQRGNTLFLPGENVPVWLGWASVDRLRKLGVARLVFSHPYRAITLVQFNLTRKAWWKEWANMIRLRTQGEGRKNGLVWPLFFVHVAGFRYQTDRIEYLPVEPDTELSGRIMLFEGFRQLPPLPVSQESIQCLGDGRYSVWNRICNFSPSTGKKIQLRDYWVTEKSEKTRSLLPIYPEFIETPEENDYTGYPEIVEKSIYRHFTSLDSSPLQPGDHVVVLTHGLSPGGAEKQWCYLALGLKKLGYRVTFLLTDSLDDGENRHYLPWLQENGLDVLETSAIPALDLVKVMPTELEVCPVIHPDTNPFEMSLSMLTAALCHLKPKAVFAQLDSTNLVAGIAGHIAAVPKILMSFRNYNPSNFWYLRNDYFQPLYRLLSRSPRVLFSGNSTDANADYARWIGIDPERVAFIPNAIDPGLFPEPPETELDALRSELRLERSAPVILGVFRLSEEKEPMAFLDVSARVAQNHAGLRVFIAGTGTMQTEIEARIESLGLNNTVTLLGKRTDIAALMTVSSLILSTSSFEGMSNVIMEAQLLGVPVVATRTGASSDLVVQGESGFVCAIGDVDALTQSCLTILGDPDLSARMGEAARQRILNEFTLDLLTERHLRLVNGGSL